VAGSGVSGRTHLCFILRGHPATALSVCVWGGWVGWFVVTSHHPTLLVAVCVCDDAAQR
jgi:hypothetical protein